MNSMPLTTIGGMVCTLLFILLTTTSWGQGDTLQVTATNDAEYLIREVFLGGGDCFEVSNVSISGAFGQAGEFSNGAATIGFDSGIVFSNGDVRNISGPNSHFVESDPNNPVSIDISDEEIDDPDIEQAYLDSGFSNTDLSTFDVVSIEFDFVPTLDSISFEYIFASEEYCEFLGTSFFDLFGFFISGPGIEGEYSNNGINLAKIFSPFANDERSITINAINHFINPEFYVNNLPPGALPCAFGITTPPVAPDLIALNGFTRNLVAGTRVIPCETYRMRIVVADVVDQNMDTAVFLKASSFAVGRTATLAGTINGVNTGGTTVVEGCSTLDVVFARGDSVLTNGLLVEYEVTAESTATPGVDFTGLPDSVFLPPGVYSDTITLEFTPDNIPEGAENFTIKLLNPCDCTEGELLVTIDEPPELTGTISGQDTICIENGVSLEVQPSGGIGLVTWEWSNGETDPFLNDVPLQNTTYFAALTDECNQTDTVFADVTVIDATATLAASALLCDGRPVPDFPIVLEGGTTYDFDLLVTGSVATNYTGITADTVFFQPFGTNVYTIESFTANGCPGTVVGTPTASAEFIINTIALIDSIACNGDNDAEITLLPVGGNGTYTYEWSHNNGLAGNTAAGLAPGAITTIITDGNGCLDTISVAITEPPVLVATLDPIDGNASCLSNGELGASASGGTGPYTYAWSNGVTESTATDLVAGNYALTVSDANNCDEVLSATIQTDSIPPLVQLMPTDAFDCGTSVVPISTTGSSQGSNFTYEWTDEDGNVLAPNDPAELEASAEGTYTLQITDQTNGCSASQSVTLTDQSNSPDFSVQQFGDLGCTGSNVATLFVADSTANWQIEWRDADDNVVGTNWTLPTTQEGNYFAFVTDTNTDCVSSESFALLATGIAPILTAPVNPDLITCADPEVMVTVTEDNNLPNVSYVWTGPTGGVVGAGDQLSLTAAASGDYTLLATNEDNGCTDMITVNIQANLVEPVLDVLPPQSITCDQEDVSLTATSTSTGTLLFRWEDANQTVISNTASATLSNTDAYTIILTDQMNGCADSLVYTLGIDTISPILSLAALPDTLDCILETSTIDVEVANMGNYSYNWAGPSGGIMGNDQSQDVAVTLAGTYTLTAENEDNGCTQTLVAAVSENREDPELLALPDTVLTCANSSLLLSAQLMNGGNFVYSWTTAGGTQLSNEADFAVETPDNYTLSVTNLDNNCTSTTDLTVTSDTTPPTGIIATPPNQLSCETEQVVIDAEPLSGSGDYGYEWSGPDGGIGNNNTEQDISALEPGDYTLVLFDNSNGCTDTITTTVTQDPNVVMLNALPDTAITCVQTSIALTATSPSMGNLSFSWIDDQDIVVSNTADYTITTAGIYTISVTDTDNDCSNTASVNVALDTLSPVVTPLAIEALTCERTTVTLGATVGLTTENPAWQDSMGNPLGSDWSQPVAEAGAYILEVLNTANGCTSSASFPVTQDTIAPVIGINTTNTELTCLIEDIELASMIMAPTASGYSYAWDGPVSGINGSTMEENVSVVLPGDYLLAITNLDNGCTGEASIQVTSDTLAPALTLPADGVINCEFPDITLEAESSTMGSLTFRWENAAAEVISNEARALLTMAGTYTAFVTSAENGCESEGTVAITGDFTAPPVEAGEDQFIDCINNSATLQPTVGPANLVPSWFDANNNLLSTGTWELNTNTAGTFQLVVLDTNNGCDAFDTVSVTEDQSFPIANAGPDVLLDCFEGIATIDASGSSTGTTFVYTLLDANNQLVSTGPTPSFDVSSTGLYTLQVENTANNCLTTDEVLVDVSEPSIQDFKVEDITCTTDNGSISFAEVTGGASPYLYSVDGGATFQATTVFADLPAGAYNIVVQDANGCEDAAAASVAAANALTIRGVETEYAFKFGDVETLLAIPNRDTSELIDFGWESSGSLSCARCLETVFTAEETEVVRFFARDINGCAAEVLVRLIVDPRVPVFVPNAFSPYDGDGDNDFFTVFGDSESVLEIVNLSVYDRWGAQVFSKANFAASNPQAGWDGRRAGVELSSGVYVYLAEVRLVTGEIVQLQGDVVLVK